MDTLDDLLYKQEQMSKRFKSSLKEHVVDQIPPKQPVGLLKSEGTMTLFQFIQYVERLVNVTMKDLGVIFIPEENRIPIDYSDMTIDHPIITYSLIDQDTKDELKPRVREEIIEDPNDPENSRMGQIYGQKFKSIIQFNIFASVYDIAEQVMNNFEGLLLTYTGLLKQKGLGELIFNKQLTDTKLDQYRQTLSIRSIRYYVETENVFVVFRDKIEEINIFDE